MYVSWYISSIFCYCLRSFTKQKDWPTLNTFNYWDKDTAGETYRQAATISYNTDNDNNDNDNDNDNDDNDKDNDDNDNDKDDNDSLIGREGASFRFLWIWQSGVFFREPT